MYQHILVPLDGSKLAECAVPWAHELAKRSGVEKVSLVRVIRQSKGYRRTTDYSKTPSSPPVTEPVGAKEKEAVNYLAVMAKNLQYDGKTLGLGESPHVAERLFPGHATPEKGGNHVLSLMPENLRPSL